ncbi:Mitochondrial distribution and morphology protein 12 [Podosphaera aphanis]|nr:Mitochondrial distribution and morphology protein 12 [Podosphaera aphanis]
MSVDINWEALTNGPEGIALAENIRDFVHEKFQTVNLPHFIKSVKVHTFELGSVSPEIEINDICDPLPDFYEEIDDNRNETEEGNSSGEEISYKAHEQENMRERRRTERDERTTSGPLPSIDTNLAGSRFRYGSDTTGASTPAIPGGTSNLNYFHSQLATGLSGAQTPLAAVAGAHLPKGWAGYSYSPLHRRGHHHEANESSISPPPTTVNHDLREKASISTLVTSVASANTRPSTRDGLVEERIDEKSTPSSISQPQFRESRAEDVQTVFRVRYAGDIKLSLTAEILLDYPMPSFVGIPVKLNITGLSFDGVAVLASIRKRVHFCFLSPEDALATIGTDASDENRSKETKAGSLLHEIKVESEIGKRERGKQVLKNVGKVEKFVLEQVRRIFEDEFVYPSFWTILV